MEIITRPRFQYRFRAALLKKPEEGGPETDREAIVRANRLAQDLKKARNPKFVYASPIRELPEDWRVFLAGNQKEFREWIRLWQRQHTPLLVNAPGTPLNPKASGVEEYSDSASAVERRDEHANGGSEEEAEPLQGGKRDGAIALEANPGSPIVVPARSWFTLVGEDRPDPWIKTADRHLVNTCIDEVLPRPVSSTEKAGEARELLFAAPIVSPNRTTGPWPARDGEAKVASEHRDAMGTMADGQGNLQAGEFNLGFPSLAPGHGDTSSRLLFLQVSFVRGDEGCESRHCGSSRVLDMKFTGNETGIDTVRVVNAIQAAVRPILSEDGPPLRVIFGGKQEIVSALELRFGARDDQAGKVAHAVGLVAEMARQAAIARDTGGPAWNVFQTERASDVLSMRNVVYDEIASPDGADSDHTANVIDFRISIAPNIPTRITLADGYSLTDRHVRFNCEVGLYNPQGDPAGWVCRAGALEADTRNAIWNASRGRSPPIRCQYDLDEHTRSVYDGGSRWTLGHDSAVSIVAGVVAASDLWLSSNSLTNLSHDEFITTVYAELEQFTEDLDLRIFGTLDPHVVPPTAVPVPAFAARSCRYQGKRGHQIRWDDEPLAIIGKAVASRMPDDAEIAGMVTKFGKSHSRVIRKVREKFYAKHPEEALGPNGPKRRVRNNTGRPCEGFSKALPNRLFNAWAHDGSLPYPRDDADACAAFCAALQINKDELEAGLRGRGWHYMEVLHVQFPEAPLIAVLARVLTNDYSLNDCVEYFFEFLGGRRVRIVDGTEYPKPPTRPLTVGGSRVPEVPGNPWFIYAKVTDDPDRANMKFDQCPTVIVNVVSSAPGAAGDCDRRRPQAVFFGYVEAIGRHAYPAYVAAAKNAGVPIERDRTPWVTA
jgi:hypothetical protein